MDANGNLVTDKPVRQASQIPRKDDDDIPMSGIKNVDYKTFEETMVPTQSSTICWNPRKNEMINMADASMERQHMFKKLEDPRREYLSRYAQIRDILCTQRFRNPEYVRKIPSNCINSTNPMNYGQGAPMFNGGRVIQPGQSVRVVAQPESVSQYINSSRGPCVQGHAWNPIQNSCQPTPMLGEQSFT